MSTGALGTEAVADPTALASVLAGDGLVASGSTIAVNPGNGIDLIADAVVVQPSEIAGTGLESDNGGPPKLRLAAAAAGTGLTGGHGADLAINTGIGVEIVADKLRVKAEVLTQNEGVTIVDPAATTATSERPIHINESGVTQTVASADITNATTLAGNNTNNFTMTVRRRNSAGVAAVIVAYTNDVASGGLTAWILKNLGALANTAIANGESITVEVTKAGTGQALNVRLALKLTSPG